jgi:hypothetical protein
VRASELLADYFSPISGANKRRRGTKLIKAKNDAIAIFSEAQ